MQQKWFQLKPVSYNINTHHDNCIQSLRKEANDKRKSAFCLKCLIEKHPYCSNQQVEELKEISEQLSNIQQLYDDIVELQRKIFQQLQMVLSQIEQIFKPIIDYQELPNLTNLNLIFGMIKENTKDNIIAYSHISVIEIKQLLKNLNCESEITPKDANYWSIRGQELQKNKLYNEAIVCFDKAIYINPKVLKFYFLKCKTLDILERFEESVNCYSEIILIEPNCYYSWYYKGILLLELKRYLEAMSCFDIALSFGLECHNNGLRLFQFLIESSTFQMAIDGAIYCYDKIIQTNQHPHQLQHALAQLKVAQGLKNKLQKY